MSSNNAEELTKAETTTSKPSAPEHIEASSGAFSSPKQNESVRAHWKCLAACTLVSLCPFQYGVDFGCIGGLQAMPGFLEIFGHRAPETPLGWNLTPETQQLISSLMTLGAFVSSSAAGPIARFISRRTTIWTASVLCCVANVIMMATTNLAGLYAGRLLIGLANGLYMTFAQLYIQETTPARYRGLMISSFQIFTSIGTLVGTVVDNATNSMVGKPSYLIPLGVIYIVPVIIFLGLFLIPESPRWLMQHGQPEKARKALRWLRPYSDDVVDEEIRNIQSALDSDAELSASSGYWDLVRNPIDRRRTVLATCALTVQGASGAMYMIAYGTYFFAMAGISDSFQNSVILITVGVVAIIANTAAITHLGRRRVFLVTGLLLCGLSQLLTAIVYTVNPTSKSTGKAIVGLAVIYILGYNGMVATYAWISGGELPSQRLRSHTFGVATAIGFFAAWLTTFTAPYFINPESLNWGPKYGYIWTPSCWISALWVYFFLPEVKGRSLEEIDEMFEARLPAKKFRKYVCVGRTTGSDSEAGDVKRREVVKAEEVVWGDAKVVAETEAAMG